MLFSQHGLICDFVFPFCLKSALFMTELIQDLPAVGSFRGYKGVLVIQSQKIPSDYRTYENTKKIQKKYFSFFLKSIFILPITTKMYCLEKKLLQKRGFQ